MRGKIVGVLVLLLCITSLPELSAQLRSQSDGSGDIGTSEDRQSSLTRPYKIQPNDLLEIFVWKEPDLTRKVLVRPDGRISFPLIQDMAAADISPAELKDEIEKKLREYIDAPNVTVIVEAIQSYRVFVTGKVQKPGPLTIEKPVTVLQALALAGGFVEFAGTSEIAIISNNGNKSTLLKFNYGEFIKGKNSDQNIFLRSGDVVVVP